MATRDFHFLFSEISAEVDDFHSVKQGLGNVGKAVCSGNDIADRYEGNDIAGVVTGLAWTETGGEILLAEAILDATYRQHFSSK